MTDTDRLLVQVRALTVRYASRPALVAVDLDVGRGDFVGIVGPSGAGKSTLLRAVLGLTQPSEGTVARNPGLRIGYVPQVGSVEWTFPLTVRECVLLARARQRNLPWATASERREADAILDRLGLGGVGDRHLRELSGGQQQRVFVARALMSDPQLIVLDEPTSGIDVRTRHQMLHLLAELHTAGRSILLATHDLNGLAAHLPEVVCLNQTIVARGAPLDVLNPGVLETTYGAALEVLVHAGLPFVVDNHHQPLAHPDHQHRNHHGAAM